MKKLLLLIPVIGFLFLADTSSFAQSRINGRQTIGHNITKKRTLHSNIIRSILGEQHVPALDQKNAAFKTTSTIAERLKSFCGYNYEDTSILPRGKSDSGYFVYSGTRGSSFNYQSMDYSFLGMGTFTSPVGEDYTLSFTYFPNFNYTLSANMLQLYPDTAWLWNSYCPYGIIFMDTFGYSDKSSYKYVGNKISEITDQYFPPLPGELTRASYFYDGTSKLVFALFFTYNTGTSSWDTTGAESFFYNLSNQVIMDSSSINYGFGMWSEGDKAVFGYDGSGNINFVEDFTDSSGYWQPVSKHLLTYYTDNSLHTDSLSDYVPANGSWIPFSKDSFGYTPGVAYFTYCLTKAFVMDTVYEKCITTKHVSTSGLPDTVFYSLYTGYPGGAVKLYARQKTAFDYDAYNNPTVATEHSFNITDTAAGTGWYNSSIERIFYYHYETYTKDGVTNLVNPNEYVLMYPNPAGNEINIRRPAAAKGSYAVVTITNALGQVVRTESLPWMNETETFSLSGLSAGIYVITLQDKDGITLSAQKILKQ